MFKRFFTEVDPMWYMSLIILYIVTFIFSGHVIVEVILFTLVLFPCIVFPCVWVYKIAMER